VDARLSFAEEVTSGERERGVSEGAIVLAAILAPVRLGEFFERYYQKRPLVLSAPDRGEASLLSLDQLVDALAEHRPHEQVLAFPERSRVGSTVRELLADREALTDYLDAGHPLVWNGARGVCDSIDYLADALSEAFGGNVWPNIYSTGAGGGPFKVHFDCHEIIALQCQGRKRWQISEVRVDGPLHLDDLKSSVDAAMKAHAEEAATRTELDRAVGPGDVVYLPRGQFHTASAIGGRSLHVSFGIQLLSGFDILRLLEQAALSQSAFRDYTPAAAADPTGGAMAAYVGDLRRRLHTLIDEPGLLERAIEERERLIRAARHRG
jgi:ribosomal protein L16 Arg81 hydroxylase